MSAENHTEKAGQNGGGNTAAAPAPAPAPRPGRRIGNPAPLGLISFASTTLLLSFVNVNARNVGVANIAVGMGYAVGGLTQLLAGMWEFACGNTFGATAFSSYGGFWISFGILLSPQYGIVDAYTGGFEDPLTLFLGVWFIFTFIMVISSLRSNIGLVTLFFCLDMTFLLLTIGAAMPTHVGITRAGGAFGIVTAFIAYYVGTSELCPRGASYFVLPTGQLPKSEA